MSFNAAPMHQSDGYKVDHRRQYPQNTVKVYANFTPRKSRVAGVDSVVVFGISYFIKDFLVEEFNRGFFRKPKAEVIAKYKRRLDNYLGPNDITYDHIAALHDLQHIPVKIKAIAEGSLVHTGVPILTITNTLPEFFWVPNFLETILSCEIWPMCTAATTTFNYRVIFDQFALDTVGNTDFSSTFQIHDFSFRGLVGRTAPAMIGAAHLLSSRGTDTIPAIDFLEEYYHADSDKELVGASVAATEHSVMCMGMKDGELATFKRLINEIYPKGIVSIVSDTWDLWSVVRPNSGILATLKGDILARDGKVVIRPDSGDPADILCGIGRKPGTWNQVIGDKYYHSTSGFVGDLSQYEVDECVYKGVIECLWDTFGGTISARGYKVLDSHIGSIYGDSITPDRAREICQRLKDKGFASINWVAGVGSYTYQYVTRDTYGFAMKATYGELSISRDTPGAEAQVGIERREIYKDPITDDGTKKSAKGLLKVTKDQEGVYHLIDQVTDEEEAQGELTLAFEDGKIFSSPTLAEIRTRVDANILSKLKLQVA